MSWLDSIKGMMTDDEDEEKNTLAGQMLVDSYVASLGRVEAEHDVSKLIEYIMKNIIADNIVKKAIIKNTVKSAEEDPIRTDNTTYWIHLVLSEYYKDRDGHIGCMCLECRNERQSITEEHERNAKLLRDVDAERNSVERTDSDETGELGETAKEKNEQLKPSVDVII